MQPGSDRATLIASLVAAPSQHGGELAAVPREAGWIEVRADRTGDLPAAWLREHAGGRRLLYTLRSAAEGGESESSAGRRRERLTAAVAGGYDLVDLEGERDLSEELLAAVPPDRRLISWHGGAVGLAGLRRRFERFAEVPARLYKLVPAAAQPGEELAPLALSHSLRRTDVLAFASGEAGVWTRLIAPRVGAPVVYGSAGEDPAAPGQPSVAALCGDYGLPALPPLERLFGIVGRPVSGSLSPRLHNGVYRELGIPALYLPFHAAVFAEFWLEVVEGTTLPVLGVPLAGLSVTTPFKEVALAVAGAPSPRAQAIGSANTLVLSDGVWEAETTDPEGVTGPLLERGLELAGRRAVVVGAGGAGRAAAFGLLRAGASVVLSNRSAERGRRAAADLKLSYVPLAELDPGAFELVVNATPVGEGGAAAVAVDALAPAAVVVDMAYRRGEATPLVAEARRRGHTAVDGREVLLAQALAQFRMMTGREIPAELGRRLLDLEGAS